MSIAYHRRWYWKLIGVSYLCSFTGGWLLIDRAWPQGLLLCLTGFVLGFAAGRCLSLARREENRL